MTGPVVAPMALLGSGELEPWASAGERLLLGNRMMCLAPSSPLGQFLQHLASEDLSYRK